MPGDPIAQARLAVADLAQQAARFDRDDLPDLRQKFLILKNRIDALDARVATLEARLP